MIVFGAVGTEPELEVRVVVSAGITGHILISPVATTRRIEQIPIAAVIPFHIQVCTAHPAVILNMYVSVAGGADGLL